MHKTIRILTLVAAMIIGAGEAWAEPTDGVNYCGKSDVNDGKNLVWYVTEEETDGVKTLHIDKNPAVTDANADFSMADYNNNNSSETGNFAPWIKPNDAGNGSDGLRYGITAVTIGAGVKSIGRKAFDVCKSLTSVTFAEGSQLESIGECAFLGCKSLTSVTFAEGSQLESIGESAFMGCEGLTTIALPSSLTTISGNAFNNCGMTTVTIPASVTSIGSHAFSCCNYLTTVTFERTGNPIPTLDTKVFSDCMILKAIFVPSEAAYAAYKAAGSGWNQTVNGHSLRSLLAPATISVVKNEWSTFCHNYGVAYSPSEGVTVHTVDGLSADGKSVNTKQVEGNLVSPGTPLLLNYSGTGDITLTANVDVEVTPSDKDIVDDGGTSVCFIGNASGSDLDCYNAALNDIIHEGHDASGTVSYVLRNGEFVIVSSNSGLKAHRCLLNVSTTTSSARRLSIARGGEATVTSTPESTYGEIFNRSSEQQKIDGGYLEFFKDEDCSSSNSLTLNHVSGLTDGKVYIKATPDIFHTMNEDFLPVVEKCSESGSGQARTRVLKIGAIEVTAVAGKTGVYQFTMPADGSDVAASAPFPEKNNKTKVKYLKWNDTDKKLEEATTDDNTKVYVLDGTETVLGVLGTGNDEIWYVAESSNLNYQDIELGGYVHLILADGAKMTCGGKIYEQGGAPDNFTIYGQSTNDGMGKLTVSNTNDTDYGINVSNITINGGSIEVTGSRDKGIYTGQSLTINGGRVKAYGKYGIYTTGSVRINGGQVEATGTTSGSGIYYCNSCTLGWTNPDNDYIKVSSIEKDMGTLDVSAVKRFVAYAPGATASDPETASGIVSGTISDQSALAGKTLRPLDGYVVRDQVSLTFSGKTDTDGKPKPDFTLSATPYYIYKKDATVTVASTGHDEDYIELAGLPDGVQTTEQALAHNFTMPAQDVTITSVKYYTTGVKYIDPTADEPNKTTADGTRVYVLDGDGATNLPGGWYVVKDNKEGVDASYDVLLQILGDTHLILADGAEMSVNVQDNNHAIRVYSSGTATLDIYGQENGTGALTANSANNYAISLYSDNSGSTSSLTINGGKVTAGGNIGIDAYSEEGIASVTINGGVVDANGNIYGILGLTNNGTATVTITGGKVTAKANSDGSYGIYAGSGVSNSTAVTITGGQVEATGNAYGIYSDSGDITLSLTSNGDYIKAGGYCASGSVKIPAGKALAYTDDNGNTVVMDSDAADYILGATGNAALTDIKGKTLRPAMKKVTGGETYLAYSSDNGNWVLNDPNAQVYVISGYDLEKGEVYLTQVTGNEIPDGVPVIICKSDGSALTNALWLVGEEKLSDGAEADCLKAVANFVFGDSNKTLQELIDGITGSTDTPVSDYVVFILKEGKFMPIIANASGKPSQGDCLLIIPKVELLKQVIVGGGSSARKLTIDLGGNATGIENSEKGIVNSEQDVWYSLDGRKLDGAPTTKGVYIHNGQVVLK